MDGTIPAASGAFSELSVSFSFGARTQDSRPCFAGVVQSAAVELQADDGEHEDSEEEQQADLQQRHHGLHDGLQDDLQT